MRKDTYLINDGGSWSVVAEDALDRIIEDSRNDDEKFVSAYEAALFAIEGDDYNVVRVVANEPLTESEDREWVARARWRLKTDSGKIIVSGGFDPDCLADLREDGEIEYSEVINVWPGDYQITFYTYLHSMSGVMWLSDFYGERLLPKPGLWYRRDHGNRPLPSWMAARLSDEDFDEDDEWQPFGESLKSGRIQIEHGPLHWIGYLFHLIPFASDMELDEPEGGWFDSQTGLRVPERFPLGIATDCTKDTEVKSRLAHLFGGQDEDTK